MTLRRRGTWRILLALPVALLAGCAQDASPLLREDLDRLRADLLKSDRALQKGQADLRAEVQQSDLRAAQGLAEVQKSLGRLSARVDEISKDSAQVQARLDELRRRVDLLTLQLDVAGPPSGPAPVAQVAPPRAIGGAASAGGPTSSPPPASQAPAPRPPATAGPAPAGPRPAATGLVPAGPEASDLYQTAYIDYTRGNYSLSIAAFKEFMRRYPRSDLAEKAQYWVGESHFSLARSLQARGERDRAAQEFELASKEFRQVVIEYPRGDRVPAALYKEALTLVELNQPGLAEARLRLLIDQYPATEEAAKAKDDLARIRKR